MTNTELGILGESFACSCLSERGYCILERNYRCSLGEIDIIAEKDGDLSFIEVKTRNGDGYGKPSEAVDFKKLKRIQKAASFYVTSRGGRYRNRDITFDIFEIEINHIKGVM